MKKLTALLMALLFLLPMAACAGTKTPAETQAPTAAPTATPAPEPTEEPFEFTAENMPRLDGSTSTAPLAEAVCAHLLGLSEEEAKAYVNFSKTTQAYYNLLSGKADLLIVGEANEEVLAEKERLGFQWDKTPFATDAFVFVVNEDNPVDSITISQARDIYAGRITNWKELGGEDREIIPFQRNSTAGSQAIMEKLVMQGEPMMEAPAGYIIGSMSQLMEAVKGYDGSPGAIGYSVYYYAREMKMAQGLKLLKLEGVQPEPATIRSGEYPLVNPKYVVIASDAGEDEPSRRLYDWLLSRDGQQLIADMGYVSIMDFDTGDAGLEPVGGRIYEDYTDHLIPAENYGQLIPYAGLRLHDDWPSATGCMYGLMTRDGMVVVDPVYSSAAAPSYYDKGSWKCLPLLVLKRGEAVPGGEGRPEIAVAATDGSWCTGFDYAAYTAGADGLVLINGDGMTLMSPEGELGETISLSDLSMSREEFENSIFSDALWSEGDGGRRAGKYIAVYFIPTGDENIMRCYDIEEKKLTDLSMEQWYEACGYDGSVYEEPEPAVKNAERLMDGLLGSSAPGLLSLHEYGEESERLSYYREDGTPLPQFTVERPQWYQRLSVKGGLIEVLDLNSASYYDLDSMDCVFRTYLNYEAD